MVRTQLMALAAATAFGGLALAAVPASAAPISGAATVAAIEDGLLQQAQYYYGPPRYYGPPPRYYRPYRPYRRFYGPPPPPPFVAPFVAPRPYYYGPRYYY